MPSSVDLVRQELASARVVDRKNPSYFSRGSMSTFEDFSELPVKYGTEEFSAEIGSKGSGLTYKASGDLEGVQNIDADVRIDGLSADYIATQINPFGGGTPEELSTLDISGVITWSLDGNGAKLDIKEITINDDETTGEVWYTLPETEEVVRIPFDGSMLW